MNSERSSGLQFGNEYGFLGPQVTCRLNPSGDVPALLLAGMPDKSSDAESMAE
ncbi:hypothetical protein OH807_05345 [Kitasatospora sp. NBC_01560]|uniref:hypothetical protein n=1 Tax=Kitasatospora sp. NBC_01560 TaxID=2975965 RepID=UPI00386AF1EE